MKRNRVFMPPNDIDNSIYTVNGVVPLNLFLGGTIDNGDSENWQQQLIDELDLCDTVHPIMIYNPRREEWNPSEGEKGLENQIKWELHHLERANLIIMNILSNSKSPISLMEIGLFARKNKLLVFCQKDFYRYKNVEVVCQQCNIPLFNTNDISIIRDRTLEIANKNISHNFREHGI
jgi:hypothetical protein